MVRESRDDWNKWLGRIEIAGGTEAQRIKFYTDLWHALLGRRIVSDVDGSYCDMTSDKPIVRRVACGPDGKPLFPHHNFDALWGSQWSLNILWSFAYPDVMDAFCNTMVDMYRDGGLIPRGPSGGNYTYVMIEGIRRRHFLRLLTIKAFAITTWRRRMKVCARMLCRAASATTPVTNMGRMLRAAA